MSRSLRLLVVVVLGSVFGLAGFHLVESRASVARTAPAVGSTTTTVAPAMTSESQPAPATPPPAPPSTTAPPEPSRGWLLVQGTGDVNFDPAYIPDFAVHGYELAFEGLNGIFLEDDLTVINLECSPSPLGTPLDKAFTFRCDPEALPVARDAGVEVANLANNHGQDYGTEAMLDGRRRVTESGLAAVGVGHDLTEATTPAVFEIDGWTVAVLGMGGVVPADWWLATPDRPGMASGDDIPQMVAAVRAADEIADIVVVSIHWGWELETEPRPDDVERARAMIEAGADIVFGHHAHRLGEVEMIDGRPVFWTLGNFIWPRLSDAGSTTAVGRVVISPGEEYTACLVPVFIERSGHPVLQGPPPCSVPENAPEGAR